MSRRTPAAVTVLSMQPRTVAFLGLSCSGLQHGWHVQYMYVCTYDQHTCTQEQLQEAHIRSTCNTVEPLYHWAEKKKKVFSVCTQRGVLISEVDLYTIGTSETVLIREVSLFQRLICYNWLIREVSLFQRLICYNWLIREVSLFQRLICYNWLIREVSLFQRLICYNWLIREVSLFQRLICYNWLIREVRVLISEADLLQLAD